MENAILMQKMDVDVSIIFLRSPEEKNQECIPTIVWILKTQMWIPQNMKMSSSNMFLLFSTMVMSMMLGEIKTQAGENPAFSSRI